MTVGLTSILIGLDLRLSPEVLNAMERLSAITQLQSTGAPRGQQWLTVVLAAMLVAMIATLIGVSYNRIQRERRRVAKVFMENVQRRSLSSREYRLLVEIVRRSGLGPYQRSLIFSSVSHFERGVEHLAKDVLGKQGPDAHNHLLGELAFLREKMGFHDRSAKEWLAKSKAKTRLTTRDIPVGKTLHITRRLGHQSADIQAQILSNDAKQLTVGLERPIRITFGELWRVRYFHGASVWEFDTAVVSFEGTQLILRHSSEVRFINRRRFIRVPARNLAFIAPFPFAKTVSNPGEDLAAAADQNWRPLEFVHAVVTELAGPGLRVEAPLPVQVGQRILIVFRLDGQPEGSPDVEPGARLIEDIAVVRRIEAIQNGYSIALELVGLQDADIDELVRATNQAALANGKGPVQGQGGEEPLEQDDLVETLVEKKD
jgi:hypothetical protein